MSNILMADMKQFCYCEYVSIRHNSKEYNSICQNTDRLDVNSEQVYWTYWQQIGGKNQKDLSMVNLH